ncbi:STAS domain-containing protein [Hyphomicrobium sp. ghe19]|uniref:STAS domain-containing protein n=1 Tax=Hyphomicrobium sp. ghe19 TaxID=2682968 RepID=UPI0013674A4F|nr:hypothetical protein HYPP_04430 [Hyphomicrobium sp. ghe19]
MANKLTSKSISLDGLLTIRTAATAKSQILGALQGVQNLTIEIPPDSDADIAGIQVVLAARNQAANESKQLSLSSPISGRFLEVMEKAGFMECLDAGDRGFWLHDQVNK